MPPLGGSDEERTLLRRNEWGELAHDQPRQRVEILLPLHHRTKPREVGLQPVLLAAALSGVT